LAVLSAIGETINLMTLGGLALAVGILVDDATVTIENVERHLRAGETLENGILIGAGEIALPILVSTLCICIVFVPMFFLGGVAGFLFAPLAEAVVFAVSRGAAFRIAVAPPGCATRRAAARSGDRQHWRREGRLVPQIFSHGRGGI
jgi:multidrug efflux pump subunit AcrB